MARVSGPPGNAATHKHRGKWQIVWHPRFGHYARAWPRKRGKPTNQLVIDRVAAFSRAVQQVKFLTSEDQIAARELAAGSTLTWKDVAIKSAMGTMFQFTTQDGTVWRGLRMAQGDIEALLNSISNTQGVILIRDQTEWVALLPGSEGQVLTIPSQNALPAWADPPQPTGPGLSPLFGPYAPPAQSAFPTLIPTNGHQTGLYAGSFGQYELAFGPFPASGDNLRARLKPFNYQLDQSQSAWLNCNTITYRYMGYGITLYDTTGAGPYQFLTFGCHARVVSGIVYPGVALQATWWTNKTTIDHTEFLYTMNQPPNWFRFQVAGTDLKLNISQDHQYYQQIDVLSDVFSNFHPNYIGLYIYQNPFDYDSGSSNGVFMSCLNFTQPF